MCEAHHRKLHGIPDPNPEEIPVPEEGTNPNSARWSPTWDDYFATEIEQEVVRNLRNSMPEAVVSRAMVQKVLYVGDYDAVKAAELLITDPQVVLDWKINTVVLTVKRALPFAQPYVHEYASAFEAAGQDVEKVLGLA